MTPDVRVLAARVDALTARLNELSVEAWERRGRRSARPGLCLSCGADLDRAPHADTCEACPPWRIHRVGLTELGRWMDDVISECTRRAWMAAAAAGGRP